MRLVIVLLLWMIVVCAATKEPLSQDVTSKTFRKQWKAEYNILSMLYKKSRVDLLARLDEFSLRIAGLHN